MSYRSTLTAITLITLALIVAFNAFRTNDTETAQQPDPSIEIGQDDAVMQKLFSLNTAQAWQITLPEVDSQVALTEIIQTESQNLAQGDYQYQEERGTVSLDFQKITPMNFGEASDDMWFVAPFVVTNQGSGAFWYLGFFKLSMTSKSIEQIDTAFIGDRVTLDSVSLDEPFDVSFSVVVSYLEHGDEQSMAEEPIYRVDKRVKVSHDGFVFD